MKISEKYFKRFLSITPLSVAIWRSVEAKHLSTVTLKRPILDIGCGFGEFAQGFFDTKVDVGVDIAEKDIEEARRCKKYKKLVLADARNLPFKNNSFSSIFSISTLEHISFPQKVIKEIYRVLKPNGIFAATIETENVDKHTFYRGLLEKIGLVSLSKFLLHRYNRLFNRYVIINKQKWLKYFENSGFVVEQSKDIISPNVVKIYDLFIATAWPAQILKPILGRRIIYRPKFAIELLTKIFARYIDEENEGTNLFIVVRKPNKSLRRPSISALKRLSNKRSYTS